MSILASYIVIQKDYRLCETKALIMNIEETFFILQTLRHLKDYYRKLLVQVGKEQEHKDLTLFSHIAFNQGRFLVFFFIIFFSTFLHILDIQPLQLINARFHILS